MEWLSFFRHKLPYQTFRYQSCHHWDNRRIQNFKKDSKRNSTKISVIIVAVFIILLDSK